MTTLRRLTFRSCSACKWQPLPCRSHTRTAHAQCPQPDPPFAVINVRAQTKDVMMGRVGNTREIANATLFFACDESSYCTATHLMVDGGQTPCTVME